MQIISGDLEMDTKLMSDCLMSLALFEAWQEPLYMHLVTRARALPLAAYGPRSLRHTYQVHHPAQPSCNTGGVCVLTNQGGRLPYLSCNSGAHVCAISLAYLSCPTVCIWPVWHVSCSSDCRLMSACDRCTGGHSHFMYKHALDCHISS